MSLWSLRKGSGKHQVCTVSQPEGLGQLTSCIRAYRSTGINLLVFPSQDEINTFYGLGIGGDLTRAGFNGDLAKTLVPHKYESMPESEIETGIYTRDFQKVCSALVSLSATLDNSEYSSLLRSYPYMLIIYILLACQSLKI